MNDKENTVAGAEKHIALHEAISDLTGVTRRLEQVINRITGHQEIDDSTPCPEGPDITLLQILDQGHDEIRQETDQMYKKIDELIKLLF